MTSRKISESLFPQNLLKIYPNIFSEFFVHLLKTTLSTNYADLLFLPPADVMFHSHSNTMFASTANIVRLCLYLYD